MRHHCFFEVHSPLFSAKIMNNDLIEIGAWAYQWKMYFNSYVTKQAQNVISSQKSKKPNNLFRPSLKLKS